MKKKWWFLGLGEILVKNFYVCGLNDEGEMSLTPPARNDAGYACNEPGIYNYATNFDIWGDPSHLGATLYGYKLNITVQIYPFDSADNLKEEPFSECWFKVQAHKTYSPAAFASTSTRSVTFVGGMALVGLVTAVLLRRRRLRVIQSRRETEETDTNFEMMTDPGVRV